MKVFDFNRPTKADNRYCGPAVLSYLTGHRTKDTATVCREHLKMKSVTGLWGWELAKVCTLFGLHLRTVSSFTVRTKKAPTVAAWLASTDYDPTAVYIVMTTAHFFVLADGAFGDSKSEGWVGLKHDVVERRARVQHVWQVSRIGSDQLAVDLIRRHAAQPKKITKTTVKKFCDAHGLTIDDDVDLIYIDPPQKYIDLRDEGDVMFSCIAHGWTEALELAKEHVEMMASCAGLTIAT